MCHTAWWELWHKIDKGEKLPERLRPYGKGTITNALPLAVVLTISEGLLKTVIKYTPKVLEDPGNMTEESC